MKTQKDITQRVQFGARRFLSLLLTVAMLSAASGFTSLAYAVGEKLETAGVVHDDGAELEKQEMQFEATLESKGWNELEGQQR